MAPVVFHEADIGGKKCRHSEKHQHTVSNDGVRNNPKFQRSGKHDARPDGNYVIFVIRQIYQTRSVIVAAPQKAAGRREAKSVKPKRLYEMDMSQYTMAGLSNQKWP